MNYLGKAFIAIVLFAFAINEVNAQEPTLAEVTIISKSLDLEGAHDVLFDIALNDYETSTIEEVVYGTCQAQGDVTIYFEDDVFLSFEVTKRGYVVTEGRFKS